MSKYKTLIVGELNEACEIKCVTLELLHKVNQFDNEVILLLPISTVKPQYEQIASKAGVDKLILLKNEELSNYQTTPFSLAMTSTIENLNADVVLFGATKNGRDLAPRISTALQTGLTADCTEINITNEGVLEATRPTYGGELMATIVSKTSPQMATVRPFSFARNPMDYNKNLQVEVKEVDIEQKNLLKIIETIKEESKVVDLEKANIVVAGGRGLKSQENFELLDKLAALIGGCVGCTRPISTKGWRPHEEQIGQTGKVVHPKLYLAFGISGAIHHVIGMDKSETVVAINMDETAPIFDYADYGLVADAIQTLKFLINYFESKKNP